MIAQQPKVAAITLVTSSDDMMYSTNKKRKITRIPKLHRTVQASRLLRLPPELRQAIVTSAIENITICRAGRMRFGGIELYLICKILREDLRAVARTWLPPPYIYIRCLSPQALRSVRIGVDTFISLAKTTNRKWKGIGLEVLCSGNAFAGATPEEDGSTPPALGSMATKWPVAFSPCFPSIENGKWITLEPAAYILGLRFVAEYALDEEVAGQGRALRGANRSLAGSRYTVAKDVPFLFFLLTRVHFRFFPRASIEIHMDISPKPGKLR